MNLSIEGAAPDQHDPIHLRHQAARCRRLADTVLDRRTLDALTSMAMEYEAEADRLSGAA